MNDSYTRYIENRLKEGNKKSNQHLCAITAVDYYGAEEDFYLLQFYNSECLLLKCKTSDNSKPKRVGIVSCSKYQHGLNEIYKNDNKDLIKKYEEAFYKNTNGIYQYDPFYNELSSALSEYKNRIEAALSYIQFALDIPVYVCYTKYYSTKAVAHALQEKGSKVILMQEVKENLDIIESKRVLHLQDFNKMYLNTVPVMSVVDCFSPQTIYIPMAEFTLDSEFCNGKRWKDLIANTEISDCCTINGVLCKCVTIKMTIDIFNNVFCTIQSINGEKKTILLHNVLGVNLPEQNIGIDYEPSPIIPTSEPTVKPISDPEEQTEPSNPVPTAEGRSIPSEPDELQKTYKPVEGCEGRKLRIYDNEPYSTGDLFGYYLLDNGGVKEICFRDPFLFTDSKLLQAFVLDLLKNLKEKLTDFRSFKIMTLRKEEIKPQDEYSKKTLGNFEKKLSTFRKVMKEHNVEVIHEYLHDNDPEGKHKRIVEFDNGWCIDLEGGLNKLYASEKNLEQSKCSKTTLYYYNINPKSKKINEGNPYYHPKKGKLCTVKVIEEKDKHLTPETLFQYYLLDDGGTSHIILRDRYIPSNFYMFKTLINKLIGIANVAHRDNENIKIIKRITLHTRPGNYEDRIKEIKDFQNQLKRDDDIEFVFEEISKEDKDGDHKRSLIFEDNGWHIDMEGGLGYLYKDKPSMKLGKCKNTTLYYCKEK